jgi:hypothetical protein
MKNPLLFCLISTISSCLTCAAFAKIVKDDWTLSKGQIVYHVHYPLKNVKGEATNVKGKGHCEKETCQFLVAVPIKNFDSGDGNRDNHMLEVTKAAEHPLVSVKVEIARAANLGTIDASAEVNFAGKTHVYDHVRISGSSQGTKTTVTGRIPLMLSHFDIERPSLLSIKIDDSVPVDFELTWD